MISSYSTRSTYFTLFLLLTCLEKLRCEWCKIRIAHNGLANICNAGNDRRGKLRDSIDDLLSLIEAEFAVAVLVNHREHEVWACRGVSSHAHEAVEKGLKFGSLNFAVLVSIHDAEEHLEHVAHVTEI